jgi:glycine C-acetyltransferase
MALDIFEKIKANRGPLGRHAKSVHGYYTFPKLEGPIGAKMIFRGKEKLVWSLNNYLGLADHPEIRKVDGESSVQYGLATPMGARMMSGNSDFHEELENQLSEFVGKEDTFLLNYGYQGIVSAIDSLLDRHDVVVYDSESHACIIDGVRLHQGKRYVFMHNDIDNLEKQLKRAQNIVENTRGGILVITEGVFGMSGDQGKLTEICALKSKYNFRLLVDDAHGFGTMGKTGAGTGEHQGCQDEIDLYFSTFAKSMASIGAFISGEQSIIEYLKYNMRSQIFAKSLPLPLVIGDLKRLELLKRESGLREKLWEITNALQSGLKERGFNLGKTNTPVTPVILNGTLNEAVNLIMDLRENFDIFCSIVVYPVIPKGIIMLRLIPTAAHSLEDVQRTLDAFSIIGAKLESKQYEFNQTVVLE